MADHPDKQNDPTKAPEFQRVLRNMLSTPPKKQSEMKTGKRSGRSAGVGGKDKRE